MTVLTSGMHYSSNHLHFPDSQEKKGLKILLLENSHEDVLLICRELEKSEVHYYIRWVASQKDFLRELVDFHPDLVILDYTFPGFNIFSALAVAKKVHPCIPVIFLSNIPGEDLVVESLKSGAADYVLKNRLSRLDPAIERAMREMDERKKREKLEALGRLAGGVAHDFNNLLSIIHGFASFAMDSLSPDVPARADIEEVLRAADSATQLTYQLLACSHLRKIETKTIDLNEKIKNMRKMLRQLIGEKIRLSARTAKNLWKIEAHPEQITQVIINLVINARDAMPEGGKITIETANISFDTGAFQPDSGIKPGDYVTLTVHDTGIGMTEEVKSHIFEFFFTTKEAGKGTGFGLATIYSIVTQHHGHIQVSSEPGEGSTFRIFLPKGGVRD